MKDEIFKLIEAFADAEVVLEHLASRVVEENQRKRDIIKEIDKLMGTDKNES